jgi:hypothetical protein
MGLFHRPIDRGEDFITPNRFLQETRGTRLHRADRERYVAIAGDHDRRQLLPLAFEILQQFCACHLGHPAIDHKAASSPWKPGVEELARAAIILNRPASGFNGGAKRSTDGGIVVYDEYRRRTQYFRRIRRTLLGEKSSDKPGQLLTLHRLGPVDIAMIGDFAEGFGGNVSRQDKSGQIVPKDDAKPFHNLKAVHPPPAISCRRL